MNGVLVRFRSSRYWDVVRYNKAVDEFNTPVTGWLAMHLVHRTSSNLRLNNVVSSLCATYGLIFE